MEGGAVAAARERLTLRVGDEKGAPVNETPFRIKALDLSKPFVEQRFPHGHRWGGWQLDTQRLTLDLVEPPHGGREYEVDLEQIETAWDLLDVAVQVARKTWCDAATAGHLLQALNALFIPQHRMRDGSRAPAVKRLADKIGG